MSSTRSIVLLGATTSVRLAAGLVTIKYIARHFGPANFGLLMQIMGVAAIFYMFAGGGITNGLIRNIAAARLADDRRSWMAVGATINMMSSLLLAFIALALWLFNNGAIFGDRTYSLVFIGIALVQPFVGIGNLITAYYSGIGETHTYSAINTIANIASLFTLIALAEALGMNGAIAGLVVGPALIGGIALWLLLRHSSKRGMLYLVWDQRRIRGLLSYAAVMVCAVTAVPITQLVMRLHMSESLGWQIVGYWQAVAKLSDAYMLFVGVIFVNHLLPELSRITDSDRALHALWRFAAPIVSVFLLTATVVYLNREQIIRLVFSDDFVPASMFVLSQLTGDGERVLALFLHYYFMSRGLMLVVLVNETLPPIATYVSYLFFFPHFGAISAVYAHVVSGGLLLVMTAGTLACLIHRT